MQFAKIRDIALHYRWSNAGPGKPLLVFSNSLGTDFRIWDGVSALMGDSASILAYDKRGHGLSDLGSPPYRMDDHVDDLADLLDHLEISKAIICGLSVGGLIAQGVIARRPDLVRALILCDTGLKIGNDETWNARIKAVEEGGLASIVEGVMERWFTGAYRVAGNPAYAIARNMFLRQNIRGYAGTCAAIRDADFTQSAKRIDVPTLCIVGDQDGATPPDLVRAMAESIKGSRFAVIQDSGHIPCLEQPQRLVALIGAFMSDLVKG